MAVPNRKRAPRQLTVKVLVLGERNVGKSATIVRFLTHRFIGHYGSSKDWIYKQPIAYDARKNMTTSVELQEQTVQYYNDNDNNSDGDNNNVNGSQLVAKMLWADAFIVIYAINDRNSFDRARYYLKAIENVMTNLNEQQMSHSTGPCCNQVSMQLLTKIKRPILLLANKCDLSRDGRQVLGFEGHSLAALHQCLFSEISAAESHMGICNTFKALLIQANSLPSQSTTATTGSDHNNRHITPNNGLGRPPTDSSSSNSNNSNSNSVKISTKLNNNLHDRYDSIKSSFRRASLAIVSSKTFVNHNRKQHHSKKQQATALLSSNSDYSSGDLLQTIDNNNNGSRCFSIGAIGDTDKQQIIADSNGSLDKLSRTRTKRRGLFKYKQRRTTITVTGMMMAGTADDRIKLKEQQKLVVAPKQEMAIVTNVTHLIPRQKSYSLKQGSERQHANRQCSSTSDVLDDDDISHDEDKLNKSLDLSDHSTSNAHSKLFKLSSDSTNLSNSNNSNERSLSRGSCSSCKSTDNSNGNGGGKRNVSKLLSIMFNRPSSVIDGSNVATTTVSNHRHSNSSNQLYNSNYSIYSKSVPLYNQIPQNTSNNNSQLHIGDITKLFSDASSPTCNQNNDDQLTGIELASEQTNDAIKQRKLPIALAPYIDIRNYPICQSSSQFHQASCARQVAPTLSRRNRRWYRLIGH